MRWAFIGFLDSTSTKKWRTARTQKVTADPEYRRMDRVTTTVYVTAEELRKYLIIAWGEEMTSHVFMYGHVPARVQVGATMLVLKRPVE
jgi:hypothetical protein